MPDARQQALVPVAGSATLPVVAGPAEADRAEALARRHQEAEFAAAAGAGALLAAAVDAVAPHPAALPERQPLAAVSAAEADAPAASAAKR